MQVPYYRTTLQIKPRCGAYDTAPPPKCPSLSAAPLTHAPSLSARWATPFSHLVRYVRKHLVELGDVAEDIGGGGGDGGTATTAAAAAAAGDVVVTRAARQPKPAATAADDDADEETEPKRKADQVFVWCDIFAINQHPGQVQADDLSQLKDCVEASQQTLLCLDDKGLVLTRIWCLYEIWNTVLAGGPPKLAVLGYDVNQDAFKEVYITLDVEEAQATVDSDRVRILADIAASTGLQELNLVIKNSLVESTQAEAENAQKVLLPGARDWKDFQRIIEAVNKHVQMLTTLGRHQEAQRYGYIISTVSTAMQKNIAAKTALASPSGGGISGGGGSCTSSSSGAAQRTGGTAGGGGSDWAALPVWHWRQYPSEGALRQVLDRAAAAERHGHFDSAMNMYRDAVDKAEQRLNATDGPSAGGGDIRRPSLDLAACRLRLAVFLASRGFMDQAVSEAGEPAVQAFEAHAGARSLTFASAAYEVAVLAKNNWQSKEVRVRLLDAAYDIQETQLGPTHEATLDTLREKAEMTYMGGDFTAGVELFHKLAVRLSYGVDLAAAPLAGVAAAAAAATAATVELSAKALEVWFLLASYISGREGREDECIRICRALIPHKRRDHIRHLRAAAADPTSEYQQQAVSELRQLGLSRAACDSSRPSSAASAAAAAGSGGHGGGGMHVAAATAATAVEVEPDGLDDPDDPRVDVVGHSSELTLWSTMLAKKGRLQDAVMLQWRLAETCRGNKTMATMETQLPSGKILMVDAYERCLMLDLQVPGIAKLAAKMLAERDGGSGVIGGGEATAAAAGDGDGDGDGDGTAPAAAAAAAAAAARPPVYDGPSYMELINQMSKLWGELNFAAAELVCRQIIVCQEATHGSVSKEAVDAREQLARLLQGAGRQEEAVAEMRAALAVHEQIRHGKDPAMSRTLQTLADMVTDRAEGEKLHRRAVDLLTKVYGPGHFELGQALIQLGGYIMSGDYRRMEEGRGVLDKGQALLAKFQEQQQTMMKAF
ncbi:WD repeat-containing protein 49 [Pleodorina starrii]|nr:WD repeat-containing protein 49 [Pleodorina starrii]